MAMTKPIPNIPSEALLTILVMSILAGLLVYRIIPSVGPLFIRAGLKGADLGKKDRKIIPESMGAICGLVYLVTLFLFIPFAFFNLFSNTSPGNEYRYTLHGYKSAVDPKTTTVRQFPYHKFGEFLSALLSLQSMLFLGFADDVLNLRWRHKLLLPTIASLPLLMVYGIECGITWVVVPLPLRPLLGRVVDLGILYYIYMSMLAVFCTNSINILAGINGLEVSQSIVIAASIALNDLLYLNLFKGWVAFETNPVTIETHLFSLYLILPFIGVSAGLLIHNRYPAKVFVGDTFTYFAGMTFAVVAILGHFSKTVLLFFIPQIFNFLYSLPQLFRFVPCPRHRLPNYDEATDLRTPSTVMVPISKVKPLGRLMLSIFSFLRIISVHYHTVPKSSIVDVSDDSPSLEPIPIGTESAVSSSLNDPPSKVSRRTRSKSKVNNESQYDQVSDDMVEVVTFNNLTLLNLLLIKLGPQHESTLCVMIVCIQILCNACAFGVRYGLVKFVYD
ncbi:glycosyl transferase family 4-domain-containing protein [Paraphysoderma sedebokerense]|nr:glycosyl transferase family 4-domain-containing protein [Paraphysoderma sedebokerense]